MNTNIVYGPTIDSEKKNQTIDLSKFEDFTVPSLNVSKKDKLDPEDPRTWTPEYCVNQALELIYIRNEIQDILAKEFEGAIRKKHKKIGLFIPRTLFRVIFCLKLSVELKKKY